MADRTPIEREPRTHPSGARTPSALALLEWADAAKRGPDKLTLRRTLYANLVRVEREAAGAATETGGLDMDALKEAMHNLRWCKASAMHFFIHGDEPEDEERRAELAVEYLRLSVHPDREDAPEGGGAT